jgi:replication factor C subunit 1
MDEVDGLDRGGASEIIQLIKSSRMPIVCTCNNRWHQKLRSLVNYCEDIRFTRPPPDLVFQYLQRHVLPHEQVSVPQRIIMDFIQQTGGDIRCILNNLQLWSISNKNLTEAQLALPADNAKKNIDLGLFDAAEKFFANDNNNNSNNNNINAMMSIEDRMQLYYNSDLIDLFVQENYLHYRPDRKDWLRSAAAAANSIATADVTSKQIFAEQTWGMGNAAAFCAAIYPCALVRGPYQSFVTGPGAAYDRKSVKFPAWLGQNSTAGKNRRVATILVKQGQDPLHGFGVGSAAAFVMDYCPTLQPRLAEPVATREKDGIAETIGVMDQYHLLREDWDSLQELVEFKKQVRVSNVGGRLQALAHRIPGPIKAALTREFNKTAHVDRASCLKGVAKTVGLSAVSSSSSRGGDEMVMTMGGDDNEDESDNDGDDNDDDNVAGKKKKNAAAASSTAKKPPAKQAAAAKKTVAPKPAAKRGKNAASSTSSQTKKGNENDDDNDSDGVEILELDPKKTNGVRRQRTTKD